MEDQALACFVSQKLSQLVPDDFNSTDEQIVPLKVKLSGTKSSQSRKSFIGSPSTVQLLVNHHRVH